MLPKETQNWLVSHHKGDLQECTWDEIREALKASGRGCPIADQYEEKDEQRITISPCQLSKLKLI